MSIANITPPSLFSPLLAQGLSALTLLSPNSFSSLLEQNSELSHSMTEHEPQIVLPPSQDNIIQASLLFAMQRTSPLHEEIEEEQQEANSSEEDSSSDEEMLHDTATNPSFEETLLHEKAERFIHYFEEELLRNGGHVREALEHAQHKLSVETTLLHEELYAIVQRMVTKYTQTAREVALHAPYDITAELLHFMDELEKSMASEKLSHLSGITHTHRHRDCFFMNELLLKSSLIKNTHYPSAAISSL